MTASSFGRLYAGVVTQWQSKHAQTSWWRRRPAMPPVACLIRLRRTKAFSDPAMSACAAVPKCSLPWFFYRGCESLSRLRRNDIWCR